MNTNWEIITFTNSYILRKIASWKTIDQIEYEHMYLKKLRQEKFCYKVPIPMIARNLQSYIEHDSSYYWLYEKLDGIQYTTLTSAQIVEIANLVGHYHTILTNTAFLRSSRVDPLNISDLTSDYNEFLRIDAGNNSELLERIKQLLDFVSDHKVTDHKILSL